jgi:aspartate kinase
MDVLKFGGTSVSSKDSLYNILRILSSYKSKDESVIMVVSALKGVTNKLTRIIELIACKNQEYEDVFKEIKLHHSNFIEEILPLNSQILMKNILELLEEEYHEYLKELFDEGKLYAKDKDRILGFGELCSAQIIKMFLGVNGKDFGFLDARKLIVTDANYGSANVNWPITRKRIKDFFRGSPGNYVVTGFIAATAHGSTTTLGRGGSDYTATVFATILNADSVVKWTDVNGIMTADPSRVPHSYSLEKMTYEELLCLSKFGNNVLVHQESIQKLQQNGIPLVIRNTFNIDFKGTVITRETETNHKAISYHKSCHIISFRKDVEISKEIYYQIAANGYLCFRVKNEEFENKNTSSYLISDECLSYFSDFLCCTKSECEACNNNFKGFNIVYRDLALITVASREKNKTLEQHRIKNLLDSKEIKTLNVRLFKNGISLILKPEKAGTALNYLHEELTLYKKEKVY